VAEATAGLASWLAWDMKDRRAVGAYFRAGIEAARETEDRPSGAYLVGTSCVQPPTGSGHMPAFVASRDGLTASRRLMPPDH
jgi:hypothetical protein